jgi:hypothetical protein
LNTPAAHAVVRDAVAELHPDVACRSQRVGAHGPFDAGHDATAHQTFRRERLLELADREPTDPAQRNLEPEIEERPGVVGLTIESSTESQIGAGDVVDPGSREVDGAREPEPCHTNLGLLVLGEIAELLLAPFFLDMAHRVQGEPSE